MRIDCAAPLVIKRLAPPTAEGEFAGIAATWALDRQGDRFARGAFADSLQRWRERGAMPPLLFNHDQREPIGAVVEAEEADDGLRVVARLALATGNGRRVHELLKAGSGALALSVGVLVEDADDLPDGSRLIRRADWLELSAVSIPAQPGAVVGDVKAAFPDRKAFEHAARQGLGLSANQAKRLAAGGWAALARDEQAEPEQDQSAALVAAITRIANVRTTR